MTEGTWSFAARLQHMEGLAAVTGERERIRTEMQVASKLQADMLPDAASVLADRKEFQLYTCMKPAKGVGGDFYDFFLIDENQLVLVMADVSGKGISAALFMVVARTLIRSHVSSRLKRGNSDRAGDGYTQAQEHTENDRFGGRKDNKEGILARAMEEVNKALCENNKNEMFVTAWIGLLTISTGELCYVNAGHCSPIICGKDGRCFYETFFGGLVLAGMEKTRYREKRIRLCRGDTLLLYTDGVTEATNPENKLYGEERLIRRVSAAKGQGSKTLLSYIWEDVEEFQRRAGQFDDIAMLALHFAGRDYHEKTGAVKKESIREFAEFVRENLEKHSVSEESSVRLQAAMDEIFSNICYYSQATEVTVGIEFAEENQIILTFVDDGIPFNPLSKKDPDFEAPFEKRKIGGLGIYLVKTTMDKMEYAYENGKNKLTLTKKV